MKRSIVTFLMSLSLLVISTASNGQSSLNTKPTKADCIADAEQIRQLVYNRDILLAQRNNFQERIKILESAIMGYQNLVVAKDNEIEAIKGQAAIDSSTVQTYKDDIETYKKKVVAYDKEIKRINDACDAALKKQKRKTTWSQIGGALLSLGLGYLFITK